MMRKCSVVFELLCSATCFSQMFDFIVHFSALVNKFSAVRF